MTLARICLRCSSPCCCVRLRSAPGRSAQKIGVVDMQRALTETEDGRKAKDKLEEAVRAAPEDARQAAERPQDAEGGHREAARRALARGPRQEGSRSTRRRSLELQQTLRGVPARARRQGRRADQAHPRAHAAHHAAHGPDRGLHADPRAQRGRRRLRSVDLDLTDVVIQRYNAARAKTTRAAARQAGTRQAGAREARSAREVGRDPGAVNLDITKILRILPHRSPFLLIDRIIELEPRKAARAVKCVTLQRAVLPGPLPGRAGVPRACSASRRWRS